MAKKAQTVDGNETEQDNAPDGFVTMYGPEDISGITVDNESYEVVDGMVYIMPEHVEEARTHGFSTKKPQ